MADVKIYSTTWCQFCKQEKAYLDEKGVSYNYIEVDRDPVKAQEMIDLSGQMGVPFTVITKDDGSTENILGFDKPRINAALGIA